MLFKMNKNILIISLFSIYVFDVAAQNADSVKDIDLLTESINISTDSLENSAFNTLSI